MGIAKLLITGATGYLSHRLLPMAGERTQVTAVARNVGDVSNAINAFPVDLTDPAQVDGLINSVRPDAIIHAAACTPGGNPELMDTVNHQATRYLAMRAHSEQIRLVSVSTDMVHNGNESPYADNSPGKPINEYGKSKHRAEDAIRACCPSAAIVRTSLIYGFDKIDRGTTGFAQRLATGQQLMLFDDIIRQPVWIDSLAYALCELALSHTTISGTLNVVGSQPMSRAEFGLKMLMHWGLLTTETADRVSAVSGAGIEDLPINLSMTCAVANQLGWPLPGVDEVLENHAGSNSR